jgi:3-mercaptopyruvate sulfurtransferase SseA
MLMDKFGFKKETVKVLTGGFVAWQKAGYPINITSLISPKAKRFTLWGRVKLRR